MWPLDTYRASFSSFHPLGVNPSFTTSVYIPHAFEHMGAHGSGLWVPGLWLYTIALLVALIKLVEVLE